MFDPLLLRDSTYLQHSSKPSWAGRLLRQFRALVDHPEDQSLIPTPTRQLTNICNYSPKKSNSLFWPLWVLHVHCTWTQNSKHKIGINKISNILIKKNLKIKFCHTSRPESLETTFPRLPCQEDSQSDLPLTSQEAEEARNRDIFLNQQPQAGVCVHRKWTDGRLSLVCRQLRASVSTA